MADSATLSEIKTRFRDRAHEPNTLFLLSASDSLLFLDELKRAGIGVAGVEGFRAFPEGGAQPVLEFSNDAADCACSKDEFFRATKDLIARGGDESLHFQIVTQ